MDHFLQTLLVQSTMKKKPASTSKVTFEELGADDVKEYPLPVISSLHWTDEKGKLMSQKIRTRSKARVEIILTGEDEFCEKRHTCEWEILSAGGRIPKATDSVLASLIEAATISAAVTLKTGLEDAEDE